MKKIAAIAASLMAALCLVIIPSAPAQAAVKCLPKAGENGYKHGIMHWKQGKRYVRVWFENPSYTKFLYGSHFESSVGPGYDYVSVLPRREDRSRDIIIDGAWLHNAGKCRSFRIGIGSGRSVVPWNPPMNWYTVTVTRP